MATNTNATTLGTAVIIGYDGTALKGMRLFYYKKFQNFSYTNTAQVPSAWRGDITKDLQANGWNIALDGSVTPSTL